MKSLTEYINEGLFGGSKHKKPELGTIGGLKSGDPIHIIDWIEGSYISNTYTYLSATKDLRSLYIHWHDENNNDITWNFLTKGDWNAGDLSSDTIITADIEHGVYLKVVTTNPEIVNEFDAFFNKRVSSIKMIDFVTKIAEKYDLKITKP